MSQITDILIPTITNKDNAFYGYGDGKNADKVTRENISYGYDRIEGHGIDGKGRHKSDFKFIKKFKFCKTICGSVFFACLLNF